MRTPRPIAGLFFFFGGGRSEDWKCVEKEREEKGNEGVRRRQIPGYTYSGVSIQRNGRIRRNETDVTDGTDPMNVTQ